MSSLRVSPVMPVGSIEQLPFDSGLDPATSDLLGYLDRVLTAAQDWLTRFVTTTDWSDRLTIAFGTAINLPALENLVQDWLTETFSSLPAIELRPASEINGAYGAFAAATDTIYLSQEFLTQNRDDPQAAIDVLLEEMGHAVDARINAVDSPGDEGAIFSALVQGSPLDEPSLQQLQAEDDTVVLNLDGQIVQLEQATPGINPAFDLIGLTQLRNDPRFAGIDGSGFSVAVIDSRMDFSHPALQPNFRTFVNFTDNPFPDFHGTHVSGTVGARDENIGVAPDVGLIGLNVFPSDPNLGAQNNDIGRALQWVLDNYQQYNITAVNMSLGGGFYTSVTEAIGDPRIDLINRLEQAGITVVSAGGNSFKTRESQNFSAPAIYSTLAVGAVWQDGVNRNLRWRDGAIDFTTGADRVVSFSQRLAAANTIFAPGALINSTVPGGGTDLSAGTSMASPIVAGAVALMQEAAQQFGGRRLTPDEVVDIIRSTADSIFDGDNEDDNVSNTNISYPRLNIYNAVSEIQRRFQQIAPTGDPNGTIQGAFIGPQLDGAAVDPILGTIGTDGGTTVVGNKDVDIFKFEVLSPGEVTIELKTNANSPNDFDTYLRLFDANGQQIAFNDDIQANVNAFSKITATLSPGVYYAGVSGFNNSSYNPAVAGSGIAGATGNYAIQFSLNNADPNGLISGAVPITFSNSQEPVLREGSIGADYGNPVGVSDVDLFEIRVPDNGTLFIDIDTPFEDGEFVDSFLRVFDAEGNELRSSDDELATDEVGNPLEFTDAQFPDLVFEDPIDRAFYNGHTTDSFIAGTVERGDVYYIGVSDYFNQTYNPDSLDGRATGGTGGLYNLFVTFINNDQNGSIPQALDNSVVPLPVVNQPGTIGVDTNRRTGQLVEVGDRDIDFVKVNSPTAGILEIDVDSYDVATIDSPVDSVLLIFDADGNLLATNDDSNDSLDPLLRYQIEANTDYFVAVTGYGNNNFDPFQLGSGSPGDTGEYIFNSRLLPLSQALVLSNDRIPSGSIEDVALGSIVPGYIGEDNGFVTGADDIDLYRFTPTTSGTVNIQAQSVEAYSSDTYLRLFNANGSQIAANDDENSITRGSFVQAAVTAGTTYYIGVNGAGPNAGNYDPFTGAGAANGSPGSYTLIVSEAVTPPVQPPTTPPITPPTTPPTPPTTPPTQGTTPPTPTPRPLNLSGTAGNDQLVGSTENDRLSGGKGNDQLTGDAGDDDLSGGRGKDRLTGGEGRDRFFFSNPKEGIDRITDFAVPLDTIVVSAKGFKGGLKSGKVIRRSQFQIGKQAADDTDRFIYNKGTGALFFDADGIGGSRQIQFAKLSSGLAMTHRDILVG